MTSIRRRTTALVALSMAALLVVGGAVLFVALRRAMTIQFDDALFARAAALRSLTRFDGTKVEVDFSGEAMPRFARSAGTDVFVEWVREGAAWRVLEQSESLRGGGWPTDSVFHGPLGLEQNAGEIERGGVGVNDVVLPGGSDGRVIFMQFAAAREHDDPTPSIPEPPAPTVRLMVAVSREPLDRTLALVGWCIAGVGGALALASIGVAGWAVGRGLLPLSDLSVRVRGIGPETLDTRIEPEGLPDELRPIAVQLSALLARLEEAFAREKRFTSAASHELRTPIAELRLLLEVGVNRPRSSEEWASTAAVALGVLERAQKLCESLLRLSREEAAVGSGNADDRADVGAALVGQANRALAMHGVDASCLRVEVGRRLIARADPTVVASILGNLLDNALRHGAATPEAPVVARTTAEGGQVVVEISNLAPALTEEDINHLFEPFWRKDGSRTSREGFGLGLAVARALARAHSGDLTAAFHEPSVLRIRLELLVAD